MCCPLAPPHKELCCWTSLFPWFLEPPVITSWYPFQLWADRMVPSWFMPEMCCQQSHVHLQTRCYNCQLIFSHWVFLKLPPWCRSQQALLLLAKWEAPRVWRWHYKYNHWSTFINDITSRLTSSVLKWYHTKCSS